MQGRLNTRSKCVVAPNSGLLIEWVVDTGSSMYVAKRIQIAAAVSAHNMPAIKKDQKCISDQGNNHKRFIRRLTCQQYQLRN